MRRLTAAVLSSCAASVALLLTLSTTAAHADVFGPIALVSQGSLGAGAAQQAEYAHDTAISGDGRYLAFDGSLAGVTGVWRRDLHTGAIEQVAGGDAQLPSLSADGRYISFTTNEGASLAAITDGRTHEPSREAVNVYVRDMASAPADPGAFTLVSAVDGSSQGLTYAGGSPTREGATAAGRSAISADGDEVAFVTTAVSNLVRYPQLEAEEEQRGETPKPHTSKLQVAVRYLHSRETVLVSRCYVNCDTDPSAPAVSTEATNGAAYPGLSVGFEAYPPYDAYSNSPPPGASLSADGSTVAWIGENIGRQAPMLREEVRPPNYTEPLWRRIEPGSATQTERVTGGSDPANPACVTGGEGALPPDDSSTDPCQGPFIVEEQGNPRGILNEAGGQTGNFLPRLSADGYTVAFISQAPLATLGENFGRGKTGQESDLYVADMHPGLTRNQALTTLTELAGGEDAGLAATAPIFDFGISPDGDQVAFATRRTQFPLGSPALVSTPPGEAGMNELYDADLANHTLTRVTHGYAGVDAASEHPHPPVIAGEDPYRQQPGDGALSPSFAADDDTLAFSSAASNLVYGDGNAPSAGSLPVGSGDGGDAFVATRVRFGATPPAQYISSAPSPALVPAWDLGVTALSRPNGSVLLYLQVPGAGKVRAGARGAVVVAATRTARTTAHRHRAHHASASRRRPIRTVAMRTVASRTAVARNAGLTTLTLVLAPRYAALARARGGLSATVNVTYAAPGHPTLRRSIPITFLRTAKPSSRSRVRSSKAHRRRAQPARSERLGQRR